MFCNLLPLEKMIFTEQGNEKKKKKRLSRIEPDSECTLTCSIQSYGSCLSTAFQAAVTRDMTPLFFLPLLRGYCLTKIIPAEVLAAYIKMTSCDFILPERSWHFNKV